MLHVLQRQSAYSSISKFNSVNGLDSEHSCYPLIADLVLIKVLSYHTVGGQIHNLNITELLQLFMSFGKHNTFQYKPKNACEWPS